MHPIVFKIGPLILYSFSLFLAIGLVLGSFIVWKHGKGTESEEKLFDSILVSFIFALLFSRIFYIGSHFDYFSLDILKWILFLHYSGFSFWGGFFGAFVGLIFSVRSKHLFNRFFDLFSLGLTFTIIFGDLGCFLGGCVVGKPASLPWAMAVADFEFMRHPLPLYLFLGDLVILILVFKTYHYFKEVRGGFLTDKPGLIGLVYLSLFFITRGLSEFYKEGAIHINDIPILGILLFLLGLLGLIIFYKKIGRSFKGDFRALFLKIYARILILKNKKGTLYLLNDSINFERNSRDGQKNS